MTDSRTFSVLICHLSSVVCPPSSGSGSAQELRRIHRRGSFSDLEMELRSVHVPRLTRTRDDLAALDLIAALDQQLLCMGVRGDVAIGMTHQDEITVALELISGISDDAVLGRLYRRILRNGDIDTVILLAIGGRAIGHDDASIGRPADASSWPMALP